MSDWGQGAKNNNIGWGQGAVNNNISWGSVHANSWAGDTNIVGFAYDADYQAILDYATTNNYTLPSDEQKLKQNQLLIDLKYAGVWNKLDTFANFATDGSTQFALIDWKRLVQYNASTGPTFTSNEGFTGNGTSSYIDTNFNPATSGGSNYTLNNASRYLYMYMASGTSSLDGVTAAGFNNMTRNSTANQRINSTLGLTGGNFDFNATRGMKSIHRTSSLNVTLFNDNTASTPQRTSLSTSLRSENQFVLRSGGLYGAHEVSMYAMGANLVSENAAFVTAYNTYINSL
jgi:hypothetical protein